MTKHMITHNVKTDHIQQHCSQVSDVQTMKNFAANKLQARTCLEESLFVYYCE